MTDENELQDGDVADPDMIYDLPAEPPSVGVHATRPVPVQASGLRTGMMQNHLIVNGDNARRLLGRDPRRARVTFWLATTGGVSSLYIAQSEGEAQSERGVVINVSSVPVRFDLELVDELWVKVGDGSADNVTLNVITEYWSR